MCGTEDKVWKERETRRTRRTVWRRSRGRGAWEGTRKQNQHENQKRRNDQVAKYKKRGRKGSCWGVLGMWYLQVVVLVEDIFDLDTSVSGELLVF